MVALLADGDVFMVIVPVPEGIPSVPDVGC
jgi:hypothetical protein